MDRQEIPDEKLNYFTMKRSIAVTLVVCACLLHVPTLSLAQAAAGRLPNGLQVYYVSRPGTALCTIDLWVRAGSVYERPGEYGCAHFLEHTLFDGSGKYPDGAADIAVESLGGIMNAATGPDYAHFYTTVQAQHTAAALGVMANMLQQALIPQAGVERERKVILDELALRSGDADERVVDAVYASAFPESAYGRSPGGTSTAILARTRDEISAFYHRRYQPRFTNLVLTGDITRGEALAMASMAFGSWRNEPSSEGTPRNQLHVPQPSLDEFANSVTVSPLSKGAVAVAFRAPRASHAKRAAAMQLMREILNHDPNFGLDVNARLRSHNAVAAYLPRLNPSLFVVVATLKPGDSATTADAIVKDIEQSVVQLNSAVLHPSVAAYAAEELLSGIDLETETLEGLAYGVGYAAVTDGEGPVTLRSAIHALPLEMLKQVMVSYLQSSFIKVVQLPRGTVQN